MKAWHWMALGAVVVVGLVVVGYVVGTQEAAAGAVAAAGAAVAHQHRRRKQAEFEASVAKERARHEHARAVEEYERGRREAPSVGQARELLDEAERW